MFCCRACLPLLPNISCVSLSIWCLRQIALVEFHACHLSPQSEPINDALYTPVRVPWMPFSIWGHRDKSWKYWVRTPNVAVAGKSCLKPYCWSLFSSTCEMIQTKWFNCDINASQQWIWARDHPPTHCLLYPQKDILWVPFSAILWWLPVQSLIFHCLTYFSNRQPPPGSGGVPTRSCFIVNPQSTKLV